jgi:hypothetical protein
MSTWRVAGTAKICANAGFRGLERDGATKQ